MTRLCENGNCQREATVPVYLVYVGDRVMCPICVQALQTIGMDVRRRDGIETLPVWRRRQQRAKDFTGSVA